MKEVKIDLGKGWVMELNNRELYIFIILSIFILVCMVLALLF
jgi:hypothetical protein